ncbi:nuclear transport factor 2 family protein [Microbaculum marinum]|uniref:Nuclear transport factor 2 family protein n=1 Tax=Microbaculum marinum TaxID=1764581 RepID=A0AAW9RM17_9HYPH
MTMDPVQTLLIKQDIHERLLAYWRNVDDDAGRQAGSFWTEDAVWEAPARTFNGREEIQGFFDWRLTRGDRLALHTVANFVAEVQDERSATSTWYLLLYAADGTPPKPSEPPVQVAAISDTWVHDGDGPWLCSHRTFKVLFEGGGALSGPAAGGERK